MYTCNARITVTFTLALMLAALWSLYPKEALSEEKNTYVGSDACKGCHELEFKNFISYAKKAHSYKDVKILSKKLTSSELVECFECHTTGYGKPGGFRSEQETPHLKDAGCEACHGPGSTHCETGDPKDIKGKLVAKDCETCHNPERVKAFNYRPLVYGGAH